MLKISKALSAGKLENYHKQEFTSPDQSYWSQGQTVQGEWQGQLAESGRDRHAVSLPDPAVAADKGGQRNRLRRTEGRIPTGAMLNGFDCFAVGSLILEGLPMLDKLLAGLRMFTFRESVELIGVDRTSEAVFFG